jgi:hypothetical protein
MSIRVAVSLLALICCLLPAQLPRVAAAAGTGDWFFVVVETQAHQKGVEADDDHPEERRWYVSNVVNLPANIPDYSSKKKAGEYFDANVVEPAKTHGILLDYYEDEMGINGGSVLALGSREQAEEMRNKDIADRKEQGGNIYSFELVFGPAKGEETSKPRLIYRDKKQPNYPGVKANQPSDR